MQIIVGFHPTYKLNSEALSVLYLQPNEPKFLNIFIQAPNITFKIKCRRRDLNPHGLLHTPLKRARIPIPPLRHKLFTFQIFGSGVGGMKLPLPSRKT